MALAEPEVQVEARIARLESDVSHIRSNLTDVKLDVRALRNRVDELGEKHADRLTAVDDKLCARMDALEVRLTDRMDALDVRLTGRMNALDGKLSGRMDTLDGKLEVLQKDLASAKVWALLLYVALAGGMYGTLARTMGWI